MNHALQNEEPVELWHVEVGPNDVRIVTLEQLDEAFQQGLVNERTRVFQDGMDEPAFLGELLGLGENEDEEEEQIEAAPPPSAAVSRNHQNTLVGLPAASHAASPARSAPPPQPAPARSAPPPQAAAPKSVRAAPASAWPPVVAAAPAQRPAQSMPPQAAPQSYRPVQSAPPPAGPQSYRPAPSAPPPMTAQTYRQVQSMPPQARRAPATENAWPPVVARPSAAPASSVVAPSVVPMALDLSDIGDIDFPRPKRTGKVLLLGVGALAVAAGVALAVTGKAPSLLNSLTASNAASMAAIPVKKAPAPVEAPKSHGLDVGDAPIKLKDAPPPLVLTTRENEATVLAAAAGTAPAPTPAADTALAKPSAKKAAAPRAVASKRGKSGGAPKSSGAPKRSGGGSLKGGGGIYDPLNGQL